MNKKNFTPILCLGLITFSVFFVLANVVIIPQIFPENIHDYFQSLIFEISPSAIAECISSPCDEANKKLGEPNYRFVDFSYQNKVGEPIRFILEKTAKDTCNSYIATITDENGEIVWKQQRASLCVSTNDQSLRTSQIKLGYDVGNPIIPLKSSRYLLKVEIDDGTIEQEFVARYNTSGISLDRTVYPIDWELNPLKQFWAGIPFEEIQCKENLVLIKKQDGTPACVTYQTGNELVKRQWASCDDGIDHGRDHPCGPHSSGTMDFVESNKIVYPMFDGVTEIINPEYEPLEYRATIPVIDDTYLSKNVQQWKDAWNFELQSEYEKYGDEFYTELGRLLMKNEMKYQMDNLGIENAEDDFEVVAGTALLSLPPHIGFSSIVHATDGHYYWLQGTSYSNQVSYYKTTQLQYPEPIEVDFSKKSEDDTPRISILPKGDNDLKSNSSVIILIKPGVVEFSNETPGTLTIYMNKEGVNEFSIEYSEKISVPSFSLSIWNFEEPGSYSWHGEVPTIIDGKEYQLNTGGGILVLSDNMNYLSKSEQMETARTMLIASGLPISGIGQRGEEDTLYISLSTAIYELLPESKQYYLQRAQNLIPFNISIKLDEPLIKQQPAPQETVPDSGSLFIPQGHELGDAHEHASILVKIFGDKFDFSNPQYQIKSSWIHFEGLDGNTIHRHSKGIPLGYLFDTLGLKLSSNCFVFVDGREFCTNQDYSLKFFINGEKVADIRDYVINQGDRILISYGSETTAEIQEQLEELNTQEIIS